MTPASQRSAANPQLSTISEPVDLISPLILAVRGEGRSELGRKDRPGPDNSGV
jgi:hypothetical protein